jgi:hypothetical protein
VNLDTRARSYQKKPKLYAQCLRDAPIGATLIEANHPKTTHGGGGGGGGAGGLELWPWVLALCLLGVSAVCFRYRHRFDAFVDSILRHRARVAPGAPNGAGEDDDDDFERAPQPTKNKNKILQKEKKKKKKNNEEALEVGATMNLAEEEEEDV